jgi:hypothetical protein
MNMTETTKNPLEEARDMLKTLSQEVSDLVEAGTFPTVNEAIMETLYKNGIHREFKSFRQWRKEGFQVKKGEKAFLLWARPKDLEHVTDEENTEAKFFPLAYVFSNAQVELIGSEEPEQSEMNENPKMELEPLPYG